jgi:S-adenosylmethionine:tRNA ribosyltransferase-isomerase
MNVTDLDYDLPERSIARHPTERREDARLMHIPPAPSNFNHRYFRDLPEILRPGDLLVLNDSQVIPARLLGRRQPDGGKTEVLLLREQRTGLWNAMVRPGKRIHTGTRIVFDPGEFEATVVGYGHPESGERILEFAWKGDWWQALETYGHTPLPPYILKARKHDHEDANIEYENPKDRERYQTVYAGRDHGSIAAPTAGLHFSSALLEELGKRDIDSVKVQLHVGAGTFLPIQTERAEDHPMHEEFIRISEDTANAINRARKDGRRIVSVGTTVARTLETVALAARGRSESFFRTNSILCETNDTIIPVSGWTRLMIAPGFAFQAIDALITNFHLPRSTLLLLVGAFSGYDRIRAAYEEAIRNDYRFFSYGDAMFLEK